MTKKTSHFMFFPGNAILEIASLICPLGIGNLVRSFSIDSQILRSFTLLEKVLEHKFFTTCSVLFWSFIAMFFPVHSE